MRNICHAIPGANCCDHFWYIPCYTNGWWYQCYTMCWGNSQWLPQPQAFPFVQMVNSKKTPLTHVTYPSLWDHVPGSFWLVQSPFMQIWRFMLKLSDRSFRGLVSSGVAVKPQNCHLECLIITKTEKTKQFQPYQYHKNRTKNRWFAYRTTKYGNDWKCRFNK